MAAQSGSSNDIAPTNVLSSEGNPQTMTPEEKKYTDDLTEKREFLANVCKPSLVHAADARRRYDYEWMVRDLFRRGYQFSKYQPNNQTVVLASRQTAKIPVNIVAAQMRSIRNQVTSFRPKYETLPRHATEESRVQARYQGKLLDYYFDHLNFKKKIKETVTQGLMYSVGGPWQIVYNSQTKEVEVWLLDTFDFFFDSLAETEEECEFMIKAVRRPKDEIIFNKDYDAVARREVTGGEARLAVSEYKQFMLQALKTASQYNREEAPTLILFEGDFRIHEEKTGKTYLRKVIWTDQNSIPLYWEDTNNDEFDYVLYHADLNPKEIYGESWMKHVMPINRVINSLESSVYDYNYRVAKGRIVVDKDSGVRAIHNVHGEIISKNKGAEVRAMDMPGLPVATQNQIERMYKYQEDIGGVHDSSLGRVPPGSRSGVMLAEMKQSDSCVDTDTEALTRRGWKKYNEIIDGEDIFLLDSKTKQSRWGKVNWIYWNDKENSDMYLAKTKTISFLTTPDHSWMTVNVRGNWKKEETQTLKNDQYIPLAIKSSSISTRKIFSDDFVELVGWVITEGTYNGISKRDKANGSKEIRLFQSESKSENVKIIKELFERLKINRKPYLNKARGNSNACYMFSFAKNYAEKIRKLFPTKSLTMDFVSKLTEKQLNLLINTMILADGHNDKITHTKSFINTNIETIDAFQFACTLLGIPTSISKKKKEKEIHSQCYVVYLKNNSKVSVGNLLNEKLKKIKFTGRIWCPNTETGYWLARKDGKIFYTGNTNQQDLVDGLEDFLEEVGRKMLKKMAKHYTSMKIIKDLGYKGEESKYFAVVGEKAKIKEKGIPGHENQVKVGPDWIDLVKLGEDNQVRVTIGSWLGYTKEMMQEKTIKLYQLGVIDQKTFLRLWEFGEIDTIVQETRLENLLKSKLQRPTGPNGEEQPDEYGLAMTENEMMTLEGKEMPTESTDDHIVHIALHQEALGKGNDAIVGAHILEHQKWIEAQGGQVGEGSIPSDLGAVPAEGMMPEDAGRNAEVAAQAAVPGAPSVPESVVGQANAMGATETPGI